jgi:hypothetical protein
MDLELDGTPGRGLRQYVWLVAEALGVGRGCCYVQLEAPAQAYIPLDDRLARLPASDLALTWDTEHGWAVGVEDGLGPDVVPLSHLGGDLLPPPRRVVEFVTDFLAGEPFGQPDPPNPAADPAELADRLSAYAARFHEPAPRAYHRHDRTTGNRGA